MEGEKKHIEITEKKIYHERIKKVVAEATYLHGKEWPANAADLFIEDLEKEGFNIDDDKGGQIKEIMAGKLHLSTLLFKVDVILSKKE